MFHDFHTHRGTPALGHYRLAPAVARSEGLLAAALHFTGEPAVVASPAVAAAVRVARRRRPGVSASWADVGRAAVHPGELLHYGVLRRGLLGRHDQMTGGWSDPAWALSDVGAYTVEAMVEQRPSPDNRVALDGVRDRHGVPRMRVAWSWSRTDLDSYWRTVTLVGEALQRLDVGEFTDVRTLGTPSVPPMSTGAHQLGGTRMCPDPEGGVVDEHLRHHQLENLHVASTGVFPSGAGYVNPTWTLVALALRLADRLTGRSGDGA